MGLRDPLRPPLLTHVHGDRLPFLRASPLCSSHFSQLEVLRRDVGSKEETLSDQESCSRFRNGGLDYGGRVTGHGMSEYPGSG